jgi:hypothetical protein
MTKAEVQSLIDTNLESATNITALKHRAVETAILNFISDSSPLLKGTYFIGNLTSTDMLKTITFSSVGTSDYIVTGSLVGASADYNADNDVMWSIREKTATGFKLALREVAGIDQNLSFDYVLFKK